jgi:uncharacterized membrane protein
LSFFSEVSVADVIGTPSVCKVRVFRTPGQIISLTSDFSFVSFIVEERITFLNILYSHQVNPILIIYTFQHLYIVQHQMKILVFIVRFLHHVLLIVVYVFIVNHYHYLYRKMNQFHLLMMILMNMMMQVQVIYPIFYSVVRKDDHQQHYKLLNNNHVFILKQYQDYLHHHQLIKINFVYFVEWVKH